MKKYILFNIDYDTDGEDVDNIPSTIEVIEDDDWDVVGEGSDRISDITGWCVFGFEYKVIDVDPDDEVQDWDTFGKNKI